jgi:neutral ceramidase
MSVEAATRQILLAGVARQDITPPLEVGLLMSSVDGRWAPFQDVRRPLYARAIVLQEGSQEGSTGRRRIAIVSLDLLTLSGKALGGFNEFKLRISSAAGNSVLPEDIVLACTHTHTAPESGAITDLYRTEAFAGWISLLVERIGRAIDDAAAHMKLCHVSYGASMAPGLGIHRRFKTANGIMMSHPEPPEEIVISREGAVDDSVNVLVTKLNG